MKTAKTAADWVQQGMRVLAARGAEAVRVEPLARALGVTKGSFYWHFKDRRALLKAVLARWEAVATEGIISGVDAVGGSAAQRLAALVQRTARAPEAPDLEQAVRAWGATERAARGVLARVDGRREAYVRALLVEHGLPPAVAAARTRVLYLALIGEFAWVSHGGQATGAPVWKELVRLLLSASPRAAPVARGPVARK